MKQVFMRRHGEKDGEMISVQGLKKAGSDGWNCNANYTHLAAGALSRTWQTLLAWFSGYVWANPEYREVVVLPAIKEFGDNNLFDAWRAKGFAEKAKELGNNLEGLRAVLDAAEFNQAKQQALAGIRKAIELASSPYEDKDVLVMAFGHSPVIELAAEAAGVDMRGRQLKELGGITFTLQEDGTITTAK